MQVRLTPEKACKLKQATTQLLRASNPSIREVAIVLGLIVSSFPGVMYRPLHYRLLESDKTAALKAKRGDLDVHLHVSTQARGEPVWWVESVETAFNPITHGEPAIVITSDASKQGWGASVENVSTGGLWTASEAKEHINYLEMLAVFFALKSFSKLVANKHIEVNVDNSTAETTINQMGTSHSAKLNALVKQIWELVFRERCLAHHGSHSRC